jgi:hypothetical protein
LRLNGEIPFFDGFVVVHVGGGGLGVWRFGGWEVGRFGGMEVWGFGGWEVGMFGGLGFD